MVIYFHRLNLALFEVVNFMKCQKQSSGIMMDPKQFVELVFMNHEGGVFEFMNENVSASIPQFLPYFLEQFELIDLAFPTQFQLSQGTTPDQHHLLC